MFLTQEERTKFATWLEERAHENRKITEPMRAIGGSIMEQVANQQEFLAELFERTAKHLRSIEDDSVSVPPKEARP